MSDFDLKWGAARGPFTLAPGEPHKVVIERPKASRMEVEDAYFNTGSAVFLPEIVEKPTGAGPTAKVEFSEGAAWKSIKEAHPGFAKTLCARRFDPRPEGGAPEFRVASLGVIIAALRFLEKNADHKLLVAGHADTVGERRYNQALSDARARAVVALLAGERKVFVEACSKYHNAEDDRVVLAYVARERGWFCDPGGRQASPTSIGVFQKTYNIIFDKKIAVDGVVGDETHGAYFDIFDEDLATWAGGKDKLKSLRGALRYVDAGTKYIACGERYPIENPGQDGYRSQANRRVELLFFAPPNLPDMKKDPAAQVYRRRGYAYKMIELRPLSAPEPRKPVERQFAFTDADPAASDAAPPEDLETSMVAIGHVFPAHGEWAFLDWFQMADAPMREREPEDTFTGPAPIPELTAKKEPGKVFVYIHDPVDRIGKMTGYLKQRLGAELAKLPQPLTAEFVAKKPTVDDVKKLGLNDRLAAVLYRGDEQTAIELIEAQFDPALPDDQRSRIATDVNEAFGGIAGTAGYTINHVAIVPTTKLLLPLDPKDSSVEEQNQVYLSNVLIHEVGHAVSGHGQRADHDTQGVMTGTTNTGDPERGYEPAFIELLKGGKAKAKKKGKPKAKGATP